MKSWSILLLALALSSSATPLSRPHRRDYAVKETAAAPRGWKRSHAAADDQIINLQIALKQGNPEELERQLLLVSDPASSKYGQHLSSEDTRRLIKPAAATLTAVENWLADHGISSYRYSPAQDWLYVRLPVQRVNHLLDAEYSVYSDGNSQVARVESYSLPLSLHEHIDTIQPTTYFSTMRALRNHNIPIDTPDFDMLAKRAIDNNGGSLYAPGGVFDGPFYCNSTVSVECIRDLYRIANYTANPKNGNKLGLTGYLEEVANREDLQTYLKAQRPDAVGTTFTEYLVNNGTNPQVNGPGLTSSGTAEAGLDIQLGSGIAYPTPVVFYSTGGRPPSTLDPNNSEPYLEWVQYVLAQDKSEVPQVISTSYGDDESSVPLAYATRVCNLFAQLGAQGTTLFFSSGDAGVGPANSTLCVPQIGGSYNNSNFQFIPSFPASCPWVTTVGGTNNIPNESMVARFPAGAGFSNLFGTPAYQASAVTGALSALQSYNSTLYSSYQSQNLFNASGRAYPDLSGVADRWAVYVPSYYGPRNQNTSGWGLIGGTSSSSPAVAAVFSQVNDWLIEHGKPVLGFLNPLLYSKLYPAFNDITRGNTAGCGTIGFPALPDFDLASGFGSPDFVKIIDILKGM